MKNVLRACSVFFLLLVPSGFALADLYVNDPSLNPTLQSINSSLMGIDGSLMLYNTLGPGSVPYQMQQQNELQQMQQQASLQQASAYSQQFSQTQNLLNTQAINEPAACAYIITQADSFIQTALHQHNESDPYVAEADANRLNYYYNLNNQCIARQQAQQCPAGDVAYQGSCITHDEKCQQEYGHDAVWDQTRASCTKSNDAVCRDVGAHIVWSGNLNSNGGAACVCERGYVPDPANQASCIVAPVSSAPQQQSLTQSSTTQSTTNNALSQSAAAAMPSLFVSNLHVGSSGSEVNALQAILAYLGLFQGDATSYYGPKTKAAVMAFQVQNGLDAVGAVGPMTRELLNKAHTGQ